MQIQIIPKVGPMRFSGSMRINIIISEIPAMIKNGPSKYPPNATLDSTGVNVILSVFICPHSFHFEIVTAYMKSFWLKTKLLRHKNMILLLRVRYLQVYPLGHKLRRMMDRTDPFRQIIKADEIPSSPLLND